MNGPDALVQHLAERGYHPRSDAHSNAICRAILADLIQHCPPFAAKARSGDLVAKLNHTVKVGHQDWNIDLAVGPPPGLPVPPEKGDIRFEVPVVVEVAVEAKCIMTEHGKARRNRLRDLQAFHDYAHRYNQKTVAVGTVTVNLSEWFWSPLRRGETTHHRNIKKVGPETVELFRSLPLRHRPDEDAGLEAVSVIVVRHDNGALNPNPDGDAPASKAPTLVVSAPAPLTGDPMHYATMVQRICSAYRERWT